ncbi:MAG: MFS transporter [Chloroflexi bacterium AL-W]|nr:MFS transporter [Chloroflexi bacterium AL-N1]NOK67472.1 MFS transporter [Chloroflexi bacterium AL-N10]NOK75036.1 MFS transporter [Chloroflexi bacterium AL-N5]NOK81823.1 MFS transporter [Chloroflexi bacterium AL-W]NOK89669.1 MFS transporter [Chloroflexi bacterium AL-N15]
MLNLFRSRLFLAITTGHFVVDIFNSIGPVLMAVLATSLGLTNGQIAFALTWYILLGSLTQPLFGWLTDRFPGRPSVLAGLSVVWMVIFLGLMAFQTTWMLILPFFLIASLGSGLFHPIGTATASLVHQARAATATSVFFFCGQVGLALAPAFGGWLFEQGNTFGILPLCAIALLPALLLITAPALPSTPESATKTKKHLHPVVSITLFAVVAFVVLMALRSTIQAVYVAFLPKLFADRGWQPSDYGLLAGVFMFAAAIGNVITGEIANRYGMRAATVWPLLLSIPAGLICLWAPTVSLTFMASAIAGLLICGQHSILVVHAQQLLPTKQGFSAGLILGFTFASGGIGTWIAGITADYVDLLLVIQIVTLLALPTALLALTLPGRSDPVIPTHPDSATATTHISTSKF